MTGRVGKRTNQITTVLSAVLLYLYKYCCVSRDKPAGIIEGALASEDGNYTPHNKHCISSSVMAVILKRLPWMVLLDVEVMVLLDTIQAAKMK